MPVPIILGNSFAITGNRKYRFYKSVGVFKRLNSPQEKRLISFYFASVDH